MYQKLNSDYWEFLRFKIQQKKKQNRKKEKHFRKESVRAESDQLQPENQSMID